MVFMELLRLHGIYMELLRLYGIWYELLGLHGIWYELLGIYGIYGYCCRDIWYICKQSRMVEWSCWKAATKYRIHQNFVLFNSG